MYNIANYITLNDSKLFTIFAIRSNLPNNNNEMPDMHYSAVIIIIHYYNIQYNV